MPKTLTNERKRELLDSVAKARSIWDKATSLILIKIAEGTPANDDQYSEIETTIAAACRALEGIAECDLSPDDDHFAVEGSDTPEEDAEMEDES